MDSNSVSQLARSLEGLSTIQMIKWAATTFPGRVSLASSLGAEDQVLLDMAAEAGLLQSEQRIEVFTLDTGRLFPETLDLLAASEEHYSFRFRVFCPNTVDVESMVEDSGINLFRRSPEDRHRCCEVRKVEPLRRALQGKALWIVGLRRDQNQNRAELSPLVWDEQNELLKLSPLLDWTQGAINAYLDDRDVPRNPLHAKGYPSIGCAPCTRAVAPGEDPRAGRWWWEQESHRECGLHLVNGRLVRKG